MRLVANVYIVGSSVMSKQGHGNPEAWYNALVYWLPAGMAASGAYVPDEHAEYMAMLGATATPGPLHIVDVLTIGRYPLHKLPRILADHGFALPPRTAQARPAAAPQAVGTPPVTATFTAAPVVHRAPVVVPPSVLLMSNI